jgi:hypothetical protein
MKSIPIVFSFARSGGTLVNQLLGVHPDCLILSEVNPAGSIVSVTKQAIEWLGLVEKEEYERFNELSYSQQISLLTERAKEKGKTLIIRDWSSVNYLKNVNETSYPSGVLEQATYLMRAGYTLNPLVVTRKASYIYYSIRRNFNQLRNLSEADFLSSYLAYARAVSSFPRVSLEALQSAPHDVLDYMLHSLSLSPDYIDTQLKTFADFQQCTGNNTLRIPSATSILRNIAPVSGDSLVNNQYVNESNFAEADRLLGYIV